MNAMNLINAAIVFSFVSLWIYQIGPKMFYELMTFRFRERIVEHVGGISFAIMIWAYIVWGAINFVTAIY